jgi:SAM-dependent methyltransferase
MPRVELLAHGHNQYYQPLLLAELPSPCDRVLDVGCGTGGFAVRLAARARHVEALDRSPAMIEQARARVPANVTCLEADVLTQPLPEAGYDAITSISALHHVPLPVVLPRLAAALRPRGILVAIAVPRADLPRDLPVEAAAAAWNLARRGLLSALTATGRIPEPCDEGPMPVADGTQTLRQVRAQARTALGPQVTVRRLLLWRYLLVWRKPQR